MKRIKELESYIDDEYFEMCHEIWFQVMEMKGYLSFGMVLWMPEFVALWLDRVRRN